MKPYNEIEEILKEKDKTFVLIGKDLNRKIEPVPSIDIYYYLLKSIVSQQLSVKVASIIWQRFLDLFPDEIPTESLLVNMDDVTLRSVGLSKQKAGYMRNVAHFSIDKGMDFEILNEKSDEEIITYLTEIKGVGKWTVQMVLMFPMDRPDVFPIDDLGIQNQMIHYFNLKGEKRELKKQMNKVAEGWKPYRTLACKLLWATT